MTGERQLIARKAVTVCWAQQKAKTKEVQGHDQLDFDAFS
jgi:hypothetical protein